MELNTKERAERLASGEWAGGPLRVRVDAALLHMYLTLKESLGVQKKRE